MESILLPNNYFVLKTAVGSYLVGGEVDCMVFSDNEVKLSDNFDESRYIIDYNIDGYEIWNL